MTQCDAVRCGGAGRAWSRAGHGRGECARALFPDRKGKMCERKDSADYMCEYLPYVLISRCEYVCMRACVRVWWR